MDSTRSDQPIALRSPINGETIYMEFVPGFPPTLDTMLQAGFVRLDTKPKPTKTQKETDHGEDEHRDEQDR